MIKKKAVKKTNPRVLKRVRKLGGKSLPKKIKIGYRDIVIEYVRPDFKTDEMTDAFGQYKNREGKIQIQFNLCGQELTNTIVHECLHAAVYGSGLNQADSPLKEEDKEEIVVNQLTNYLMGIFRDNKWFLDFIKNNMNKS